MSVSKQCITVTRHNVPSKSKSNISSSCIQFILTVSKCTFFFCQRLVQVWTKEKNKKKIRAGILHNTTYKLDIKVSIVLCYSNLQVSQNYHYDELKVKLDKSTSCVFAGNLQLLFETTSYMLVLNSLADVTVLSSFFWSWSSTASRWLRLYSSSVVLWHNQQRTTRKIATLHLLHQHLR